MSFRRRSLQPDFRYRCDESVITLELKEAELPKPATSPTPEPLFRSGQRVLLLEDRDDFREVLHEYLVSRSFQVVSVPTGVEGLREIMKDRFDLIICDMMMPQVGGEMFYWAATRARPATGQRFIFFTGHQNDPKIKFFFERIKATVLLKPFKLEALDSAIREVVRKCA
jgi:DNA-binding response OmpR family regulator